MFVSHRHLFALLAACIGVVSVVVAFKYSQSLSAFQSGSLRSATTLEPLAPDSSFYGLTNGAKIATTSGSSSESTVTAYAYLVGDVVTGKIYMEKNADTVFPVASMSKLITAITATDIYKSTKGVTVTQQETLVASDTSQLKGDETFTVKELLYPLLLNSSNVAAEALASSTDRAHFLELMSSYAWEIGMRKTFFADPSGISPQNMASTRDFFTLARDLYSSRPDILAITRTSSLYLATTTDHNSHNFVSIHPFVYDANFLGGKTGHTDEASDTMLTIMNMNGRPIAFIVLKSQGRAGDTRLLIDAYKNNR